MRLGILTSHPIQYQAPWFRALAKEVDLEVFFAHRQTAAEQGKAGFGVAFEWDVDLLSGYQHRFLNNVSRTPGVNHFAGCNTPEIADIINGQSTLHATLPSPRFDAFIVTGWYLKSYLQAVRACRAMHVPVLVRGDSQLGTPRSLLKRAVMEVRQRWLLRGFDAFLSVGQRHSEYLQHFGVPQKKIFFVPHFVDNEWFSTRAAKARSPVESTRSSLRSGWGAGDTTLVALFVGKFQAIKRPLDLLRAMAILNSQPLTPNYLPVFIGSGELGSELRSRAAALGVSTIFEGFKNQGELPACYAAADVLVLPSGSETWGLVVNEAMACGLPTIVSDAVGCAPDLIEEGRTGFTFPVGNAAALADRLCRVAEMKAAAHDWRPALAEKMQRYHVAIAVRATLAAVDVVTK